MSIFFIKILKKTFAHIGDNGAKVVVTIIIVIIIVVVISGVVVVMIEMNSTALNIIID